MLETNEIKETEVNEFDHLIKLLDDEDDRIYNNIKERFLSYGERSLDYLETYLDDENSLIKKRAREIISILNFETIEEKFRAISVNAEDEMLEESFLLLAAFGYPEVVIEKLRNELDKMALDIETQLLKTKGGSRRLETLDILNTVNNYLFFEKGLKGNADDYYNPDNSYVNRILETGLGIPISLSVIYLLLAKRLDLPVYGVSLPGHFILKYSDASDEYYVDPFNKGVIISVKEAQEFIKKTGLSKDEFENIPYLKNTTDKEIVLRLMRNLKEIYFKEGDKIRSEQLESLMNNFS